MTRNVPLVVIDDHPIVHTGVMRWVAEACIPTGAVPAYRSVAEFLDEHQRDSGATGVIVFDPERGEERPDYVGLQQLCDLKHRVVVYSRISSAEVILKCLDGGAVNYIVKSEAPHHLIDAIMSAQLGMEARGPLAAAAVRAGQQCGRPELTAQERRVLIEWAADRQQGVGQQEAPHRAEHGKDPPSANPTALQRHTPFSALQGGVVRPRCPGRSDRHSRRVNVGGDAGPATRAGVDRQLPADR